MASSDDEEEMVPRSVTNYYFEDGDAEPVSFSALPLHQDGADEPPTPKGDIFLHGSSDGGLQKVYKQVTRWRLGLQGDQPELSVHTKDGKWIELQKPRKIYEEETARTILVTVHMLHFLAKKPESSEKSLWAHLDRVFSFENKPSEDDLMDHYGLIRQLSEGNEMLANCELLLMFLKERPRKKISSEDIQNDADAKKPFIVAATDNVGEGLEDNDGDESDEEPDLFDSVCAICDNGGELLCCEGRCLRSFHATRKAGEDSDCKSLGYSRSQVEAIQNFLCKNCQHKQHQCFACGKLGRSDKSAGAEVFQCANATCGHFYHPKCVAQLLHRKNNEAATEYQQKILDGESFTCPVHKCMKCGKGENKEVEELQFAVCRRCPKSYHRGCLPRNISFDDIEEEDIVQRAWDDLLPNRILIYCLAHEIDEDLGTPIRNHIKFPEIAEKKKVGDVEKRKVIVKKKNPDLDVVRREQAPTKLKKMPEKLPRAEGAQSTLKSARVATEQVSEPKKKAKLLNDRAKSDLPKSDGAAPTERKASTKEKSKAKVLTSPPKFVGKKYTSSFPVVDAEIEKRIRTFMEKASSKITLEHVVKKLTMPSTHSSAGRVNVDKSITLGKVEGSVEAARTALKTVEGGGSVEDARAVCEPLILTQIHKWSNKLKVYLSPFLHGVRYTSFGRHFTKVDKLVEIVDKLQWYAQNGDTIVDFCCGANDFSQLMKEKLEAVGKKCEFKNFDVIQPKNDFCFEKRDWMTVMPNELPDGSRLIMGLNPPFGLKAALANKFIDKALQFRPKLIILIVPPETERLDKKREPYDLVWEDFQKLSGKSFYLPGSVDVNDKQIEQWNNTPPVLYMWSRSDFTGINKSIAVKQGHLAIDPNLPRISEEPQVDRLLSAVPPNDFNGKVQERREPTPSEKEVKREGNKSADKNRKRTQDNHNREMPGKKRKQHKEEHSGVGRKANEGTEMSISPMKETRAATELSKGYVPSDAYPRTELEVPLGGRSATNNEDVDEITKRYSTPSNRDGPFNTGSYSWSGRNPYSNDIDGYGRTSGAADIHLQSRLGVPVQDDISQRNRFSLSGPDPALAQGSLYSSPAYGLSNPAASGSSAMHRYTPRLDEPIYSRAGRPPPGGGVYDLSGTRDIPPDPASFAPGSQRPYPPRHGSSGWLND